MKNLIRIEELGQFVLVLFILVGAQMPWWVFLLLLLGPDIGMLGYLMNPGVGAVTYNVFHHKGVAVVLILMGQIARYSIAFDATFGDVDEVMFIVGVILYGHASMDRIFGYGLKFGDNFHHTHLGWIGKGQAVGAEREAGQGQ